MINDVVTYFEYQSKKKYDIILDLDITSPLRTLNDLTSALDILNKHQDAYNLFSVSPANRNPYFNMVEETGDGYFGLCKKGTFLSRQSAPRVYDMNASFYFYRRKFFEENLRSAITEKSVIYEVPHICFDLDHSIDFEFMSFLINSNKLDFEI